MCRNDAAMCCGVLDGRRHPVDPALEPADAKAGVAVEDAAEDVLAEQVAERRHRLEHPDADAVELVRRRRRALADVVRHREPRLLDGLPHAVHRGAREVDRALLEVLAGLQRHEERPEAERLQLLERAARAVGVPPVDEADAEDPAARALLHLGDVLVVDPEAELADLPVRPAEQGEHRVRERQLPADPLGVEGGQPGVDVARVRTGDGVVLREHLDELAHEDRLAVDPEHPAAVDVHHPGCTVLHALGEPLVEDVRRERDVVVGREHLGPGGQAHVGGRTGVPVLGRSDAVGRVRERPRGTSASFPLDSASRARGHYFGLVAMVNGPATLNCVRRPSGVRSI